MDEKPRLEFKEWVKNLPDHSVDIWREALANLRHLGIELWNAIRILITLNGVFVAAGITIFAKEDLHILKTALTFFLLGVFGLIFTLVSRSIMSVQRDNYLKMMIRKTLLEKELGFYDVKIQNVDLSFPWKVESQWVQNVENNPDQWHQEQRRRKDSISNKLFALFDVIAILYSICIASLFIFYRHQLFALIHCY